MAILAADIKYYQCATWADGDTHGGAISATEITGGDQSVFPDITNEQRFNGVTLYRKIYVKNEGSNDTWESVKVWLSNNTAGNTVSFALGDGTDVKTAADDYTYSTVSSKGTGVILTDSTNVTPMNGSSEHLHNGDTQAIWLKMVVSAESSGQTADDFTLMLESS